jgi:hypothetical protein
MSTRNLGRDGRWKTGGAVGRSSGAVKWGSEVAVSDAQSELLTFSLPNVEHHLLYKLFLIAFDHVWVRDSRRRLRCVVSDPKCKGRMMLQIVATRYHISLAYAAHSARTFAYPFRLILTPQTTRT